MSNQETAIVPVQDTTPIEMGFNDSRSFDHIQRVAKMFATSQLVPAAFQGNIPNVVIALNMAHRMGADPMAVMQNIYIVHGKPSWSSTFIIACINSCGRYSPLRFEVTGKDDAKTCVAWANEKGTNERLEGPPVSIGMAKAEGWYAKNGSKWKTMEELMLRYRAATLFGRLYAPEILMGMKTVEEVLDIEPAAPTPVAAPIFQGPEPKQAVVVEELPPGNE
jgi:hypothetical protein